MKILHIIVGLGDGGAEKALCKLATNKNSDVHSVISLTTDGKYGPVLRKANISVKSLGFSWRLAPVFFFRLARAVREVNPELVHAWMPHASLVSSLVVRRLGIRKLFWSIRASDYGSGLRSLPTRFIVKLLALMSDRVPTKILVVGQRALQNHVRMGFSREKMVCIPNGYESAGGDRKSSHAKNSTWPASGGQERILGTVARYHPQKDHLGLLQALFLLLQVRTDWKMYLVGSGISDSNRELVGEISRLGLSGHVVLKGPLRDPTSFYRMLDYHVLPSSFGEGFPNVVAESMLEGIPNVVTDVGDAAEIVADTGWVAQPNSPESLATALLAALKCEPSDLRARRHRSRKRIIQDFSLGTMVELHSAAYRRRQLVVFPRYARLGASSRVRMYQFEGALEKSGWDSTFFPFSDDKYLLDRYKGKSALWAVIKSYATRIHNLRYCRSADLVWVEKEILPWFPDWLESFFFKIKGPLVYDFDDAVYEQYRSSSHRAVRLLLQGKISSTSRRSQLVIAGNEVLETYFHEEVGVDTVVVPSVVDMRRIKPAPKLANSKKLPFVIGWIGSPTTFRAYLEPDLDSFRLLAEKLKAELWVVGAGEPAHSNDFVKFFPWSEETESALLGSFSVGIMPLADDPWSRAKCGFKLIQCMAAGVPVIASPVGLNEALVDHGQNGFLALGFNEWERYLSLLRSDSPLRESMGIRARKVVESKYSLAVAESQLVEEFAALVAT